jgi:hypothetical protein
VTTDRLGPAPITRPRQAIELTDIARYRAATEPWIAGEMTQVVAIEPGFRSGIRLVGWCA